MSKSRHFTILLYSDNSNHVKFINDYLPKYEYAIILHDKDFNELGEILKPHYHCIISFGSPRSITAVKNELFELGIEKNLVQDVKNLKIMLRYLTHKDNPEKYQYNDEDIKGNINISDTIDDNEKALQIMEIIEKNYHYSFTEIVRIIVVNGLWSEYRRGAFVFNRIIDETRARYFEYENHKK